MFIVDSDRTELDVEVHPSLFGFRVHITGLHGEVQGDLRPDGTVDLSSTVGARVSMNVNELDLGNPLLTRTTHGALGLAGDGSVTASLIEIGGDEAPPSGRGQAFRFTFEVESGTLRGRLGARATVSSNDDGSVTVTGATEFSAADFDLHLPGLGHLRGVCHWTVVVLPRH
ncbi:MAG: hypothetical protein ACXWB2_20110 [Acidimicrobiales bacterium]